MRETVIRPLGLVTQPNKYGVYPPGALSRADNVVIRQVGILQQLQRRTQVLAPTGLDWRIEKMHSTGEALLLFKHEVVVSLEWQTSWLFNGGVQDDAFFIDVDAGPFPSWNDVQIGGHRSISTILFRSRTICNSDQGIIAADYTDPHGADQQTIRYAGLPQPLLTADASSVEGEALAPANVATYSCVITRTYPDGYVLISEPAPLIRVLNNAGDGHSHGGDIIVRWVDPMHVPSITDRSGVRAGDLIEVYRSPAVESDGDVFGNVDSGSTLYLVQTHVITDAEIAVGAANFIDKSGAEAFGPELYTNPGQEAGGAPRRRPPAAMSCAQYKGFAFYSNLTYPAQWKTGWPGGFGNLNTPELRAHGVGIRSVGPEGSGAFGGSTPVFTVGSPLITGLTADDVKGMVPGQYLTSFGATSDGLFPTADGFAYVYSVDDGSVSGTPSITMDRPADATTAPTSFAFSAQDLLELDGAIYTIASMQKLMEQFTAGTSLSSPGFDGPGPMQNFYSIVPEPSIAYDHGFDHLATIYDQRLLIEPSRYVQGNITVRATNGKNYDPPIPEIEEAVQILTPTREPNLSTWSWADQPECVAPGNALSIGYGEIQATIATRDAIWYHASDGLYRLTGYGTRSSGVEAQFRVDLIDRTVVISNPNAITTLRDAAYSYTNRGLIEITDSGARELSEGTIGDILPGARLLPADIDGDPVDPNEYFMCGDDDRDEVWLGITKPSGSDRTEYFVYRVSVQAFTKVVTPAVSYSSAIVFAEGFPGQGLALAIDGDGVEYYNPDAVESERATVDYQPVSVGDPLTSKQWIDCALIFDLDSAGGAVFCNARFNGSNVGGGNLLAKSNDSRLNVGVPRRAPAVGHTLAPGVAIDDNDVHRAQFYGLSLRFEVLAEQQLYRR